MNDNEQRKAAKAFADRWKGIGNEEQDKQNYWKELLKEVYGIDKYGYLKFEIPVRVTIPLTAQEALEGKIAKTTTKFIDIYLPFVKVLIEQKGIKYNLDKPEQRGDLKITPLEQAKLYNNALLHNERARWIITSNFKTIRVYDTAVSLTDFATEIQLEELPDRFHELDFLVDDTLTNIRKEAKISENAGRLVGELYDALREMYADPDAKETLHGLNVLMVRLVFLLYAEDAGLLQAHNAFGDFVKSYKPENLRSGLKDLFRILDEPIEQRDPDEPKKLLAFPYINGGLFSNSQSIRIPQFSDKAYDILLNQMSYGMDWKTISPTIFGMVFESTLDSKIRHAGGMHYTSLENIHKILDNLFLNDLRMELDEIKGISTRRKDGSRNTVSLNAKNARLDAFREKLSKIHILDPASGSGNFLTESYLSLRKLENEAIRERYKGIIVLSDLEKENPIKVNLNQFHGIEINDFAVAVNKTALWIAEAQMYEETRALVTIDENFLPLSSNSNIIEGNALQIDWNTVCTKDRLTYIIGNPPFIANTGRGKQDESSAKAVLNDEQRKDRERLFGKAGGVLDYVACWFKKAADFMKVTKIRAAFVATDSICQGQQVTPLWKPLFDDGIVINFAYHFFEWESKSANSAVVFVIIIGFSYIKDIDCKLFTKDNKCLIVNHLNAYLIPAQDVFLDKRRKPLCNVSIMHRGSQPTDKGNFIFSETEYKKFINKNPDAKPLFRPFMMGEDFLKRKPRFCLWLVDADKSLIQKFPEILKRIQNVKEFRLKSTKAATRRKADTPMLFDENQQPKTSYVALPKVSSGNRRYIPIDYLSEEIVAGDKIYLLESSTLYDFGILISNVHMAWMRVTCSYYGPSYQYSNTIAYNNFPWPKPTKQQKERIEKTAQNVLDIRKQFPNSTLKQLYDNDMMLYPELKKAHQANDHAVMDAYGFRKDMLESEIVSELFRLYQELTETKTC